MHWLQVNKSRDSVITYKEFSKTSRENINITEKNTNPNQEVNVQKLKR